MNKRLSKLEARRSDPLVTTARQLNEVYKRVSESESVKYAIGSMQPIDPEYTKNTYLQAERVCKQLDNRLTTECEFEYQGSVTNDTHIKAKSDIDVLLVIKKFYVLEAPQKSLYPYAGDTTQDLLDLRNEASQSLIAAFPEATVDTSGGKSIAVNGGSLRRKVDVVPSNWLDTNNYAQSKNKIYRAVEIIDARTRIKHKNTPFLHNYMVNQKDIVSAGGLRKCARLMKSLKYDSDVIEFSSYDITSLAYSIPTDNLVVSAGMDLALVDICFEFCNYTVSNQAHRDSLLVPDGHRRIFEQGHATLCGLRQLTQELYNLRQDILAENVRSFKKLEEARVYF
ncbi:MAG: hypothetical protein WAT67_01055 [Candidatus Contendobacter sp.]